MPPLSGTWGVGPFGNDAAGDFCDESGGVAERERREAVRTAFLQVLDGAEAEVDASEAQRAVAAALPRRRAVLGRRAGRPRRGPGTPLPDPTGLRELAGILTEPSWAHTPGDVVREADRARQVAERCAASPSAPLLPHIGTADVARDMDRIRAALGEERVSYLGASCGTQLGTAYASLFPGRGDRIVLDSNLGPGGYDHRAMRLSARGLEDRFPDFAAYVAARPEYGLGTTPRQVRATCQELARRLEREPVQGRDETAFRGITYDWLYADADMPELAEIRQALDTGGPVPEQPPFPGLEALRSARFAVICGDSPWPRTIREYQRDVRADSGRYPLLGGATADIGPCAFRPRSWVEKPVRVDDQGPSNLLLVQNERGARVPFRALFHLRLTEAGCTVAVYSAGVRHGQHQPSGEATAGLYREAGRLSAAGRPPRPRAGSWRWR
ncbi:alpha/beta fold hydrolase [Streptomyces diastaticus]|uniref:alpha/beta fold hydrolase n=1 Tax=Streptomyces diastaticus TaxID=1956 RepID=UPI00365621A3